MGTQCTILRQVSSSARANGDRRRDFTFTIRTGRAQETLPHCSSQFGSSPTLTYIDRDIFGIERSEYLELVDARILLGKFPVEIPYAQPKNWMPNDWLR